MPTDVQDLIFVLQNFFPRDLSVARALYILLSLVALIPILRLHQNQQTEPRQPRFTGWFNGILSVLTDAFHPEILDPESWDGIGPDDDVARDFYNDLRAISELLNLEQEPLLPTQTPPVVLCTTRLNCILCPPDAQYRSLRRRVDLQSVRILQKGFTWSRGDLYVAHCRTCRADYYPDRITYPSANGQRLQRLEYDAEYLRVSKHGIWMHRRVAYAQELALKEFRAGWSGFANWVNGITKGPLAYKVTNRQSQRLFVEHFSRRLLVSHSRDAQFTSPANLPTKDFAGCVRMVIGENRGVSERGLHHSCAECTHLKRFRADLVADGVVLGDNVGAVVENDDVQDGDNAEHEDIPEIPLPAGLSQELPVQMPPADGEPRGYVRMAVMDGKTLGHKICALDTCTSPLVNYKTGRFCETHLDLVNICGIMPCGRQVKDGESTCDNAAHMEWYKKWKARFGRLTFPGVQRVIRERRLREDQTGPGIAAPAGPDFQVRLPALEGVEGNEVSHTFRAQSVYCIETIQWACGTPIGWGKCYRSESSPQVLGILNHIWSENEDLRPGFITYDDACDLLRHIVTQNPHNPWLQSTKFIVDAWHYIGHRSTDLLCRLWCNPAPTNGSQPDLILVKEDNNGRKHQTRAFNTETAEQFNAWLNGFEAHLRQMTDINFDFYMHVLFLIYTEKMEDRAEKRGLVLGEEFWEM